MAAFLVQLVVVLVGIQYDVLHYHKIDGARGMRVRYKKTASSLTVRVGARVGASSMENGDWKAKGSRESLSDLDCGVGGRDQLVHLCGVEHL